VFGLVAAMNLGLITLNLQNIEKLKIQSGFKNLEKKKMYST